MTLRQIADMMRQLSLLTVLVLVSVGGAFGQFQIGPHLGLDLSDSDFYLGADAVFDTPWELNDQMLRANPEINFYFLEDSPGFQESFTLIALNLLYPLNLEFANTYVGAGVILGMYNADFDEGILNPGARRDFGDTDIGLLGKFGIDFGDEYSKIVPWVEGGVHIIDGGGLWAQGGARFSI